MSTQDRFERRLPALLDDLAVPRTPAYYDDILGQVARTRQRPGWTFPERWLPMSAVSERLATAPRVPLRAAVAVALLILALAAAAVYVGSQQHRVPAPFGPARNGAIPYVANGDIYLGDPVAGTSRLLVGGPSADAFPQFSPDGTTVAFTRDVGTGAGALPIDIYVVRADGSDLRRITPAPIAGARRITWAPDGRHLAVAYQAETTGGDCGVTFCHVDQLDLFDATGTRTVEPLVTLPGGLDLVEFRPPDGREILYRATVDGKLGLFAMDADSKDVRTIVKPTVPAEMDLSFLGAAYSPDGSRIFYQHGDATGCCRLWVVNADGTDDHEYRDLGPAWDGQAVVSPDGTRIAYWHNANDGPRHGVFVARTDGAGPVIETGPKLASTAHWVWAPDSSRILMYPDDDSSPNAYLLDPNGGPYTTVPWRSDADIDWQRIAP